MDRWPLFIFLFEKGRGGPETSGLRLNSLPTTFPKESSRGPHKTSSRPLCTQHSSSVCDTNITLNISLLYCCRVLPEVSRFFHNNESSQRVRSTKFDMRRVRSRGKSRTAASDGSFASPVPIHRLLKCHREREREYEEDTGVKKEDKLKGKYQRSTKSKDFSPPEITLT